MATKTMRFSMDMTCAGCTNAAKKVLNKIGIENSDVDANYETKIVTVTTILSTKEVLAALEKTGKKVAFMDEN